SGAEETTRRLPNPAKGGPVLPSSCSSPALGFPPPAPPCDGLLTAVFGILAVEMADFRVDAGDLLQGAWLTSWTSRYSASLSLKLPFFPANTWVQLCRIHEVPRNGQHQGGVVAQVFFPLD